MKGKDLTMEKREELELQKQTLLKEIQDAKEARHDARMKEINNHTTEIGNKVTEQIVLVEK